MGKKKKKKSKSLWDRIRRNPAAIEDILGGIATMTGKKKKVTPNNPDAKKSGQYTPQKVNFLDVFKR